MSLFRCAGDSRGVGDWGQELPGRAAFVADLVSAGVLKAMADEANRKLHWSDVLVERRGANIRLWFRATKSRRSSGKFRMKRAELLAE